MIFKPQNLLLALAFLICSYEAFSEDLSKSVNQVETYRVPWWGTEGSERTRPDFEIIHIDNGALEVRYVNVAGRKLGEMTMPYWHISSFLSILNKPAELAHQGFATFTINGEHVEIPFIPQSGAAFASMGNTDVIKLGNRIADKVGRDKNIINPLLMELYLIVSKESKNIQVLARFTNTGDKTLYDVSPTVIYEQQFNWSDFGSADASPYQQIYAPKENSTRAFYAFSSGMKRGYEIVAETNCSIFYELSKEMNLWRAKVKCDAFDLEPNKSNEFNYVISSLDEMPEKPDHMKTTPSTKLKRLTYYDVKSTEHRSAPVKTNGRVMLPQVLANIEKQKIRGLNLRGSFPQTLQDLDTLKDWGGNLIILDLGDPEEVKQTIEKGHELGMEMLLAGQGGYKQGSPSFETFYSQPVPKTQQPDSHGQDEDHYYWHSIRPIRDFEADFGKPIAQATQEEKVIYWGRCFHDKWQNVAKDVKPHAPDSGIWFYMPTPGIANVDPLDYYDIFLKEISKLGDQLTVFPFYYGIKYNQAEYMVRSWKDAGVHRAVFLPMSTFYVKPSQFIRNITAARRGQADGACGFYFFVGQAKPGTEWEWKSVMLASWANFPTPDLDAFCFIEEPAELVEALAVSDVIMTINSNTGEEFARRLDDSIPGQVRSGAATGDKNENATLLIETIKPTDLQNEEWIKLLPVSCRKPGKGFLQMTNTHIRLSGVDEQGIANAQKLLLRFAELAKTERGK